MLISSTLPPAAPSRASQPAPQTETWANGIQDTVIEGGHSYQLPSSHAGVPSQIEVRQRWGGFLSPKVSAKDAQGHQLEAQSTLAGFHRAISVSDPQTGITTVFDPQEHTLEAQAPEKREVSESGPYGNHLSIDWTQAATESLDAQGNLVFRANLSGHKEIIGAELAGPHASMPVTLCDESHFTEVTQGCDGKLQAREVSTERGKGEKAQSLPASLGQGGVVNLGQGQSLELLFTGRQK